MVVGNGLVAKGFSAYKNEEKYLVFASGVSNSANTDESIFEREKKLLFDTLKLNKEKTFIYFSTCSIYDASLSNTPYVKHKLEMESMIQHEHDQYHIFRVSNLSGNTNNPHTVLNFFVAHIKAGTSFHVWKNAVRNIIDIDDLVSICNFLIKENKFLNEIINIANPYNYTVTFIVEIIESLLYKKGNYIVIDKSSQPVIDTKTIEPIIAALNISFDDGYLQHTLKKYYIVP